MKAIDRLHDARAAIQAADYGRALAQMIWFHEHALEEDPALRGVRLSFALADWVELGKLYPEAARALYAVRSDKASKLLSGKGSEQDFVDVSAIDEHLNDTAATYTLFQQMKSVTRELAEACSRQALPAIVAASDFVQARQIYGDPHEVIRSMSSTLNEDMAWARDALNEHGATALPAFTANYVEAIKMLLSTFDAIEGQKVREALRRFAIEAVNDSDAREQIAAGLGG